MSLLLMQLTKTKLVTGVKDQDNLILSLAFFFVYKKYNWKFACLNLENIQNSATQAHANVAHSRGRRLKWLRIGPK